MTFNEEAENLIADISEADEKKVSSTEDIVRESVLKGAKLGIETSIDLITNKQPR